MKECCLCSSPAICNCVWGLYDYTPKKQEGEEDPPYVPRTEPMQNDDFCQTHLDELWKKIHGIVNIGRMHFVITPVS